MKVEVRRGLVRNGRQVFTTEARWRMAVARDDLETIVHTTELSADEAQLRLEEDRMNAALTIFNFIPSSRWTPNLETLELINVETTVAMVDGVGRVVAPPTLRTSPSWSGVAPMFARDPEVLERQAANQLQVLTSFHGVTFEPGDVQRWRSLATTDLGIEAPMVSTVQLTGMDSCFPGDAANGCVSVELTMSADTESVQNAMDERIVLRSIDGVTRLLLETATLMPHRVTFTKSTWFTAHVGNEFRDVRETDEITWLYRYPIPRAGAR